MMKLKPYGNTKSSLLKELNYKLKTINYISIDFLKTLFIEYLPQLNSLLGIEKFSHFVNFLQEAEVLEIYKIKNRNIYVPVNTNSIYKKVLYFHKNSFLSHFTALYFHQLTLESPKKIYVSFEEPPRKRKAKQAVTLSQKAIDEAFSKPIKQSKNIMEIDGHKVQFILRRHSNLIGIIKREISKELVSLANLERTLIEAVVRPEYCGGINEVVNVFKLIYNRRLSAQKFLQIYNALGFIYPYHQAIGFLLEKTNNVNIKLIQELYNMPKPFKFYLVHNIPKEELNFDPKWKIYYPRFLELV